MGGEDTNSGSDPRADDQLLTAYRRGDQEAAARLFDRYYQRLVALVRVNMGGMLREVEEASDVVQSVFHSVFLRGRDCRIEIGPRDSLWPLLVAITLNKIRNRAKFWHRKRRDRRRQVRLEEHDPLERGPLPADAAEIHDLIKKLLELFPERRRRIVEHLLLGIPVAEIARRVGTSERTVYKTRQAAVQTLQQLLESS